MTPEEIFKHYCPDIPMDGDIVKAMRRIKSEAEKNFLSLQQKNERLNDRLKSGLVIMEVQEEQKEALQQENEKLKEIINKAISVLQAYIAPDSDLSEEDAISELFGILDNKEVVSLLSQTSTIDQ